MGNDPVNKADPSGNCTAHTTGIGYDCDYNSVAPPVAPPDSNLPPPGTGAIAGAAYGGYAGSVVGGIVSGACDFYSGGACDFYSGGACAPANPAIVGGTTIAGAALGGWLGTKWDKLSSSMFSKSRSAPPEKLPAAEGRPHSIIKRPGKGGQYTTYNGDGTWKQYRGSGQDHGGIPGPNVKEVQKNITPGGREFLGKIVRPVELNEIPGE